ncbi:NupC/NupG family nucleoside CNT transporter [candidate division LCP-89 bacterium B3_LCP]|uniref:NupC/NupG family nucleoside CNT transporter n=1 Tax=candidate division LCP-89 bacterium B3_LCP TaxID=2012998 RepID=A0A532V272_UNCL8|nr:MAG: NupC/NupG family nucleoside CNT transporter [candidate division LCP-89 bacterium B3_LCP]
MARFISILGMITLLGIAFLLSNNRKKIKLRTVLVGTGIQFGLGVILLWWEPGVKGIGWVAGKVYGFLQLSQAGVDFLFGNLGKPEHYAVYGVQIGLIIASTIIFFSACMAILYYLGIMQLLVEGMAKFMRWAMRTSGTESLSCSANVFVGQTEAPLLIRPFLDTMTKSELHAVMVGGFATIAGSVLASYMSLGVPPAHLITASVMSAPAALVMAKIIFPETEQSKTAGDVKIPRIKLYDNVLDAATRGTTDGLKLAVNVLAMLISFLALIALVDVVLGGFDSLIDGKILKGEFSEDAGYSGIFPANLRVFFGLLFSPLAFLMGVPWGEASTVGNLLGLKIAANEFVGYLRLSEMISDGQLSERSITIATYALCGFANFGSIGIQLGGIGALAPERRSDLAKLGLKAMMGGALASWMTATIAGLLI